MRRRSSFAVLTAVLVAGLSAATAACDTDTASPVAADTSCAEGPATSWANFGEGFFRTYCQGCHAASAQDRHGAPAAVVFDTTGEVAAWRPAILATATGAAPSMPPAGGVPEDERARLAFWLTCDPELRR